MIHKPHWKWLIVVYFFLGGIAGAAYVLAVIAEWLDPRRYRSLVRAGRYVAFAALVPSPVLLILDLGRPERFLMMLRVLKLRSPMSLGTWALTAFGGFSAFSAAVQAAEDGLLGQRRPRWIGSPRTGRIIATIGSPFALFVAGYTGVLLAATAVPLWTKRALLLGPLFLSSAVSTATAAISLVLAAMSHDDANADAVDRLDRFGTISAVTELGLLTAWIHRLGPTARPLTADPTGRILRRGTIAAGLVAPLYLSAVRPFAPTPIARLMGYVVPLLTLGGGFALRYVVVVGGGLSADDPQATFALTAAPESPPFAARDVPPSG